MGRHSGGRRRGRRGGQDSRRGVLRRVFRRGQPAARQSRDDAEVLADIGYQPNANQLRHEPMPASHHADQRQEAVVRNEEFAANAVPGSQEGEAGTRW